MGGGRGEARKQSFKRDSSQHCKMFGGTTRGEARRGIHMLTAQALRSLEAIKNNPPRATMRQKEGKAHFHLQDTRMQTGGMRRGTHLSNILTVGVEASMANWGAITTMCDDGVWETDSWKRGKQRRKRHKAQKYSTLKLSSCDVIRSSLTPRVVNVTAEMAWRREVEGGEALTRSPQPLLQG